MSRLPILTYSTKGLPEERAFPEWQAVMAPLFHVEPARLHGKLPRGSAKSILIGEVIANRSVFTAQHLTRDAELIASTPGPLLLQAYISGGFHGKLAGRTVTVSKGTVAVTDLRKTVDVQAASSNTVGLALPQSLVAEFDANTLTALLDPTRNRQLAAWIIAFYRRLPRMCEADVPVLTAEIVTFLRCLCANPPGATIPVYSDFKVDLRARAEQIIQAELGSPDLLPAGLAERLQVSRATLYRVFAPVGGVRRRIQEQRLRAAYEALSDPLEPRQLAQIASDLGFGSSAHFSRSFHEQFGQSPDTYRTAVTQAADAAKPTSLEPVRAWWTRLGQ